MKANFLSKTEIKKALKLGEFNPREEGSVMRVVVDMGYPNFWINRAIEELTKVQYEMGDRRDELMAFAMSLIALTIAYEQKCERQSK